MSAKLALAKATAQEAVVIAERVASKLPALSVLPETRRNAILAAFKSTYGFAATSLAAAGTWIARNPVKSGLMATFLTEAGLDLIGDALKDDTSDLEEFGKKVASKLSGGGDTSDGKAGSYSSVQTKLRALQATRTALGVYGRDQIVEVHTLLRWFIAADPTEVADLNNLLNSVR